MEREGRTAVVWLFSAFPISLNLTACLCITVTTMPVLRVCPNHVLQFDFLGRVIRVFRNEAEPPTEFFYAPAFLPQKSVLGSPCPIKHNVHDLNNGSMLVTVSVLLFHPDVANVALDQLRHRGYNAASVSPLPYERLSICLHPDSVDLLPQAVLKSTEHLGGQSEWDIDFLISRSQLAAFLDHLPILKFRFTTSLPGATVLTNRLTATAGVDLDAQFRAFLDGRGITHVHRDDMRTLMADFKAFIKLETYLEAPHLPFNWDHPLKAAFEMLLGQCARVTVTEDVKQTTFDGADLRPSELNRDLNRLFTQNDGTDTFKLNTTTLRELQDRSTRDVEGSAGASFLCFTVGASGGYASTDEHALKENHTYTRDELHQHFKRHDITLAREGRFIQASQVEVYQRNAASRSASIFVSNSITTVSTAEHDIITDVKLKLQEPNALTELLPLLPRIEALDRRILAIEREIGTIDGKLAQTLADARAYTDALGVRLDAADVATLSSAQQHTNNLATNLSQSINTNSLTATNVNCSGLTLHGIYRIQTESGHFVVRDCSTPGDNRFAYYKGSGCKDA